MEKWAEEASLLFMINSLLLVSGCNTLFHHSNIPELCVGIVLVKIITRFLVILQGTGF